MLDLSLGQDGICTKKRQIYEHIKPISNDVLNLQKNAKIVKSANMLGPYLKENAGEKSSESSVPSSWFRFDKFD